MNTSRDKTSEDLKEQVKFVHYLKIRRFSRFFFFFNLQENIQKSLIEILEEAIKQYFEKSETLQDKIDERKNVEIAKKNKMAETLEIEGEINEIFRKYLKRFSLKAKKNNFKFVDIEKLFL